jgi:hypothetical protein
MHRCGGQRCWGSRGLTVPYSTSPAASGSVVKLVKFPMLFDRIHARVPARLRRKRIKVHQFHHVATLVDPASSTPSSIGATSAPVVIERVAVEDEVKSMLWSVKTVERESDSASLGPADL